MKSIIKPTIKPFIKPINKPTVKAIIKVFLIISLISFISFCLVIAAGCEDNKEDKPSNVASSQQKRASASQNNNVSKQNNTGKDIAAETTPTVEVKLYFSDDQAQYLVPEVRKIDKTPAIARAALEELIKGPSEGGHFATIPQGTKILNLDIINGIAYVNFSKEIVENHSGGSAGELMTVNSVVDTLTEFKDIKKVRFMVEGKKVETLVGHMDLTEPLARDESLIKK
ncbi:MAG: GerMN domain-containing protein [Actinomycetota bacterium]